ncbi:MAG: hypothetical protein Q4Q23_07625, partial [Methanobacteriaceae archaeon]|nr:hypothetical protein [Methanobacteriaceae archaeon]
MGVNTVFATDNGSMGDLSANLETQNTVSDISAINPSYDVTNDNALKKDTSTDNITQKNTNKYNNINNKQKQEETNNTIKTTTNTINTNTKTTGTGNFEELEKAINDTNRGETLNLTGNYTRNGEEYLTGITINRTITINGDGFTIDGMNNGRIFQINTDGNLTLNNMTLTKGTTTNTDCGAIYNNGGTLTINNCTLTNNTANSLGGAIYNTGGTINITNSILTHNNATGRGSGGDGGAIYNTGNGVLCVVGSVFLNNTAGSGSAVYKLYGGVVLDGNWWGINDPTSSWGNLLSGIGTPGSYVVMDFINSSKYDRVSVDMFVCSYLNGTKIQVDLPLRTVQFSTEINNGTFNLNSTNFTGNATTKYTGNTGILKANIDNENLKYKLYNPDSFTHLEDLINSTLNNSILKLEGNFTRDNNETGYTDGI